MGNPIKNRNSEDSTASKRKIILIAAVFLAVAALAVAAVLIISSLLRTNRPKERFDPSAVGSYYSIGGGECELTLKETGKFLFVLDGLSLTGDYRLEGSSITLDFDKDGEKSIVAVYENATVTLSYNGAALRLFRRVDYTVSFETDGGSKLAAVTVTNGQTVKKPADPVKENYLFVGWYMDSEFKLPFTFASDIVTSDLTLYARWIDDNGLREYTVSFDVGYTDGEAFAAIPTIGGRIFDAPIPERSGFVFNGWWISTDNNAERLSYRLSEDVVITSSTTVYALWYSTESTVLLPPSLTVSAGGVSWGAVSGARSYDVTVTDAGGSVLLSKSVSNSEIDIPFADYPAGVFSVKVVANASTAAEDNSEAYYTYVNKGLDKVGGLFVSDGSFLVYDGVDGAERYLVTVVCGNENHIHTDVDNGSSRTFSFANCPMAKDGIKFTVKAVADGFLTSVSDELIYKRELSAVDGFNWNGEDSVLTWNSVENADFYTVSVDCGESHNHLLKINGATVTLDLGCCRAGEIGVSVYPVAEGYLSPAPSKTTVRKVTIPTPDGLSVNGALITWAEVDEAVGYELSVNGSIYSAAGNSLDLSAIVNIENGNSYEIKIRAVGDTASAWSAPIVCHSGFVGTEPTYSDGVLYWDCVIEADYYEIKINDFPAEEVRGATLVKLPLTQAGENIIKLRFVNGEGASEWTQISVVAHSVVFDTLGGTAVNTVYLATGDKISLPLTERAGYRFLDWYNVPGGAAANGKRIDEQFFEIKESITLYAYYLPEKYEIVYNYGLGGTGGGANGTVEYGSDYTLEIPVANEVTLSFGGWFEAPYGKGTQYTDPLGNSLIPWNTVGGKELYAFWIDETLVFNKVKVNGRDAYAVSMGPRISLVAEVTVPAYHNGLPVAMIDGGAFAGCIGLKTVSIPATVEVISGLDPFAGCSSLTDINVYAVEGVGSPKYKSEGGVLIENRSTGAAILRMPAGRTGSYVIPDGIGEIAEGAFTDSALASVTVSADVTKIGNDAFNRAASLKTVAFALSRGDTEKELSIGKRAFAFCTALENITLPTRLSSLDLSKYYLNSSGAFCESADYAFVGCTALESVKVASGSHYYSVVDGMIYSADGGQLIYCPTAKRGVVNIAPGTQSIASGAFVGCDLITEIVIPNTVTYIGEYAFSAIQIGKLTFKGMGFSSVTVGDRAFANCTSLSEVMFEEGSQISVIGERAFLNCTSLKGFTITSSVVLIRDGAFENCKGLESVSFEGGKRALEFGKGVFGGCTALTTVNIPANVSVIPGIFGGCTSLKEVKVDKNNPYFTSQGGVVFNKDKTEIIYFPQGKGGEYAIPDTVTSVAAGVFAGNRSLTALVIPNTVSYIGEEAFKNTDIDRIVFMGDVYADELVIAKSAFEGARFEGYDFTLPPHTKSIGDYAFAEVFYKKILLNDGLESIGSYAFYNPSNDNGAALVIPASVVSIGEYCFSGETLSTSYVTAHRFMDVKFTAEGSALTSIGDFAFYKNAKITSAIIPDSVKSIGNYAFYECYNLAELTLPVSLEVIGAYAFAASAYTYQVPISTLEIPASVHTIGARAFENCQMLTTVSFLGTDDSPDLTIGTAYRRKYESDGVEMFSVERGNVFASCTRLTEVSLSPNVIALGDYCFTKSGDFGFRVSLPADSRLATIGAFCFYKSQLVSFTVPATVRNLEPIEEYGSLYNRLGIGDYAFAVSVGRLTEITFLTDFNSYPLTIGYGAFENQSQLTSIKLPARLSSYVSADGSVIPPLANGALVFYGARSLSDIGCEQGCPYTVSGGVLYTADLGELVYCPTSLSADVVIPSSVTRIQDYAFFGCNGVSSVTFAGKSNLSYIGDYAFYGASAIESITLPSGVGSLGEGAFNNASSLLGITLSKNLESLDISVFDGCTALKNIYVPSENAGLCSENGVLYSKDKTVLLLYPYGRTDAEYTVNSEALSIGAGAFAGNESLHTVFLPSGLVEIGERAFEGCSALTAVTIPVSVEIIGDGAFSNTLSLESLLFAEGEGKKLVIGDGAFGGSGVGAVKLPARLAYIGNDAFRNSKLALLSFESAEVYQLSAIGGYAFAGTPLVAVILPSGITTVGDGVFYGAARLESLVFGEGLEAIGKEAFKGSSVKTVHLPASLKTLGASAFYGCSQLQSVSFASGSQLEAIPAGCFYGCTSLKSFSVPTLVRELGGAKDNGAFEGCKALSEFGFEGDDFCTVIGDYAFRGCSSLVGFGIPSTVGTLGNFAFADCSSLSEIVIHRGTVKLGEGTFAGCTSLSRVEMNTGSDRLPERMFEGCTSLTHIFIPSGVGEIGEDCFRGSSVEEFEVAEENRSLVSVDGIIYNASKTLIVYFPPKYASTTLFIPKEVVEIREGNFRYSTGIKEVIFEEGGTAALNIGSYAFDGCYQIRRVVLPERLVSIGSYAFRECYGLTSITIPRNVKTIGYAAFSKCAKLYEVYNESSIENITKDTYIDYININSYIGARVNIFTPTEGSSVIEREGEFLFTTVSGVKRLIGYEGDESVIRLPDGSYELAPYMFSMDTSVQAVIVPSGVTLQGSFMFDGCDNLRAILLMSEAIPDTWPNNWNNGHPVFVGYTGAEITYTFNTNGASAIEPVVSSNPIKLPTPSIDGKVFMGWYDNAELVGEPLPAEYYSSSKTELYAAYMDEAEYVEKYLRGQSMEYAHDLLGTATLAVDIRAKGTQNYFKLTAAAGDVWNIATPSGMGYHKIWIYDAYGNVILEYSSKTSDLIHDINYDFTFVKEGTYFIGVGYKDQSRESGSFEVTFTRV